MKKLLKLPKKVYLGLIILIVLGVFAYKTLNPTPIEVTTTNVQKQQIYKTLTYSGKVESRTNINLSFPVSGTLLYLPKKEGEEVEKNEVLARLDSTQSYYQWQKAKETVEQYKSDIAELKRKFELDRSLFNNSEDVYNLQKKQLESSLQSAEFEQSRLASILGDYYLNAPEATTIVESNYDLGETVTALTTVLKLADLDNLYFDVNVDIEDIKNVSIGQKVLITLDSNPTEEITGTVSEISNIAHKDSAANTVLQVKVNLTKNGFVLSEEGDAKIVLQQTSPDALTIPYESVVNKDNKTYVYVIKDNKAILTPVQLGLEGDLYYEVKSGLSENDKVVASPSDTLFDQAKVVEN